MGVGGSFFILTLEEVTNSAFAFVRLIMTVRVPFLLCPWLSCLLWENAGVSVATWE